MAAKRILTADRVLIVLVGVLAVAVRVAYVYYNQEELIREAAKICIKDAQRPRYWAA